MRYSKPVMVVTVSFFMLTLLVGLSATTAHAQVVRWKQIIGIRGSFTSVGSGAGAVDSVDTPWSTLEGRARVNLGTGDLNFRVKGLVLASTNSIGTPGVITQVTGTLVCDTDGSVDGNSARVDTPLVTLSAQGNAQFTGNVGPLPAKCVGEPDIAFVILPPGINWIANGAVRTP